MNVSSIAGGALASQVPATGTEAARHAPPPPPPDGRRPDAGGFVKGLGEALSSLGVGDVGAGDKDSAGAALGSFLQELMASLHEQGEAKGAAAEGTFGPGGPAGHGGGPGRLAEDLQGLISSLQGDAPESGELSSLESSFSSLLDTLGVDSGDTPSTLASFLQTLADKLPQAGSSGNLINTTA
jgi:hypothetical protein